MTGTGAGGKSVRGGGANKSEAFAFAAVGVGAAFGVGGKAISSTADNPGLPFVGAGGAAGPADGEPPELEPDADWTGVIESDVTKIVMGGAATEEVDGTDERAATSGLLPSRPPAAEPLV